ncbi:hypothetical protein [Paenibacillus abyssi]|uniref:Uncharacterized protein n=1 Tax=Paenibacillus abyssi TaxID=1340531 RepID=A0A917CF64_9BACL|nr:hypothetical protein [Paenibacillus abyssi]GGF86940.1 hypothetical protein GCM10010916_00350 [Paenibacillus abyssi]
MRRMHPGMIIILSLMVIGIIWMLLTNPGYFIIPIAVLGVIYLLYKFPPSRFRSKPASPSRYKPAQPMQAKAKSTRKKNIPFRVIEGGKDDDNVPKYH